MRAESQRHVREFDVALDDGRTLHADDAGGRADALTIVWHHGTPNIGAPPAPLFTIADRLGLRWVSYDRPGYGGSTPHPGRDVASAAGDVAAVADALGVDRFATSSASATWSGARSASAHHCSRTSDFPVPLLPNPIRSSRDKSTSTTPQLAQLHRSPPQDGAPRRS